MRSYLLVLGLLTMLVGCAEPYGEDGTSQPVAEQPLKTPSAGDKAVRSKEAPRQAVETTDPTPAPAKPSVSSAATVAASGYVLTWSRASEAARYSLDVFLKDGTWIGPCVATEYIGKELTVTFEGECPSSPEHPSVDASDIDDFMMCSAENNDWQHPTCTRAHWDGVSTRITIEN